MKKIAIICAVSLGSIIVRAQKPVLFKLKFLPNHDYNASMKMSMDIQTSPVPSANTKSNAANKTQTMSNKMEMTMKFDIKTGAIIPSNSFPVTMKYENMDIKMSVNGKETPPTKNPLVGQAIYGHGDLNGKFQIDSISGMGMNEQLKTTMTGMINKIQGQVVFPEHALKIGESFTQETPINIPAGAMAMEMKAKMTYKLTSIKANLAYF